MPNSDIVLAHLRASTSYRAAFASAFPGQATPINYDNVGRAIGAFERGLVTLTMGCDDDGQWTHGCDASGG